MGNWEQRGPARPDATIQSHASARRELDATTPDGFAPPLAPLDIVKSHDRARRARLVRLMALGVGGISLVLLPSVFIPTLDSISLVALLIVLLGAAASYFANRFQRVGEAGYLLLGGGTLGIAWVITARGLNPGLTTTDLRLYDFFILPIVLSGVISNRRMPILLGGVTGSFTVFSLLFLRHAADLQLYWEGRDPQTLGSVYDVIAIPLVIQGLTAVAAWLGADSVRRSLLSATKADELTLANERILAQAYELESHQRLLREGILHLQRVHTAFARGNFEARAQLAPSELQPLALSLNYLLTHMQRLLREQGQRSRIEMASHELAIALRRLRAGAPYAPPPYTGTSFDEVLLELVTAYQQGMLAGAANPANAARNSQYPNSPSSHYPSGAPHYPGAATPQSHWDSGSSDIN
ncbi:MAG TPA: hypothetical protein VKQ36_16095 [Ktedonobacterales bacterium]|nr:hypothetical protein [Ktedonobacterales bacterium]